MRPSLERCAFVLLVLLLLPSRIVEARGKGPVAVWAASNDIVLLADSSLPGIVVVSLSRAIALERLATKHITKRAVGVASCLQCNYIVMTAAHDDGIPRMVRVDFAPSKGTVADILAQPDVNFFDGATVSEMIVDDKDGNLEKNIDPRMVVVADDGGRAFTASSETFAVYKMNVLKKPVKLERVFSPSRGQPFGIGFDRKEDFLVAMHKKYVLRVTPKGKVLETYDLTEAKCPGIQGEQSANLRVSFDNPLDLKSSILILASKPLSYDAVVWQYDIITNTCEVVAGKLGSTSGWLDGVGDEIRFSRPHHMMLLPAPSDPTEPYSPTLVITDIDNRALRLLDLQTRQSRTVMYDRDQRALNEISEDFLKSERSCDDVEYLNQTTPTTSIYGELAFMEEATLLDVKFTAAKRHCKSRGMRLCEPSELRETGVGSDLEVWTNAECASCWQKRINKVCKKKIRNEFEPPGGSHSTEGFRHSWNSGVAYEIGANLPNGPATICHDFEGTDGTEKEVRAAALCCADCLAHSSGRFVHRP